MTNMINDAEASLLKTDTRGRVFTPPARREQLLDEFERSGLSGAKFAALTGLKYPTFAAWVQARRQQSGAATRATPAKNPAPTVRWLEAVVGPLASPGTGLPLAVQLPGGARLELTSAQQLPLAVELLRALARPSTPC